ncbi:DUF1330 domain-containing protein [Streptomyces sp. NBC_01092]|uniref:DUF1330 domain-containing protein n=1 Tax=Streptomyces sp. NBC_01092 TaxID=2903748 RepID=UPI00386D3502
MGTVRAGPPLRTTLLRSAHRWVARRHTCLLRSAYRNARKAGDAQRAGNGHSIEFDSFEQAVAAHESAAYQEALVALSNGVERDFRIVEGID